MAKLNYCRALNEFNGDSFKGFVHYKSYYTGLV